MVLFPSLLWLLLLLLQLSQACSADLYVTDDRTDQLRIRACFHQLLLPARSLRHMVE